MSFDLYYANCTGNQYNCEYPYMVEIKDTASLIQAVSHDYVCADYRNHYRSKENFLSSNTLAIEFDNDHSDDPKDWITPEIVRRDFPEVSMAVHYSRNNMKEKNGRSPRPKFHLFMECDRYTSVEDYSDMKRLVAARYPFVDINALDGARFFYGTTDPKVEYYPGTKTVNQALEEEEFDKDLPTGEIKEGSRNSTMFHWAVRYMKRFGNSDESKNQFYQHAEKCNPPLDDTELNAIWRSACKYYDRIRMQPDYVNPEEYNNPESESYVDPIPFSRFAMAPFPVDALPKAIRDYVDAVAESTQTPADMAGATAISVLSVCLQGKYKIRGKDDWFEPLNTYSLVIAQPSERKSAVLNHMIKPMNDYEQQINTVSGVADTIRSYLHFSVPDEGPLTDYESWMPDFMKGLADGIRKSRGLVQNAMKEVSADMVITPQLNPVSALAGAGNMTENVNSNASILTPILEAIGQLKGNEGGDIIVPVYIGQERIDEIVVTASQRANYRSGGR